MSERTPLQRIFFWIKYGTFLVGILLVLGFGAHFIYFREMQAIARPNAEAYQRQWDNLGEKFLTKQQYNRLGRINMRAQSNFVSIPMKKEPGTIRIGCFGDSYTLGKEVEDEFTFPAFLQKLFAETNQKVEVINFGNNWYGFQQAIMMYDYIGKRYDLDYVIFGPEGFFAHRETQFNHAGKYEPGYIHARYVLDGESTRLVDPVGDNFEDRFHAYFRFVTPWKYLRFDRVMPSLLRALLPAGRKIENPFYYHKESAFEEGLEILRRLFVRLNKDVKVIVFNGKKEVVDVALAAGVEAYHIHGDTIGAYDDSTRSFFPYYRIVHYGPNLNYEYARFVFQIMQGTSSFESRKMVFSGIFKGGVGPRINLTDLRELSINIAGKTMGELMQKMHQYDEEHLKPVNLEDTFNKEMSRSS